MITLAIRREVHSVSEYSHDSLSAQRSVQPFAERLASIPLLGGRIDPTIFKLSNSVDVREQIAKVVNAGICLCCARRP